MSEYRWHIFLANLEPTIGSEQGLTRPILVISDENINQILPVINVLPLTSLKKGRTVYPNEVLIPAEVAGLLQDSIVLCHQIRTLDKKTPNKTTRNTSRCGFTASNNRRIKISMRNILTISLDKHKYHKL